MHCNYFDLKTLFPNASVEQLRTEFGLKCKIIAK